MQKYFSGSNPTLLPNAVVLQVTPSNHLNSFRKHRFDFHPLNGIGWQLRLDHPAANVIKVIKSSNSN